MTGNKNESTPTSAAQTKDIVKILRSVHQLDDDESFLDFECLTLSGTTKTFRVPRGLFRTPTKVVDFLMKTDAKLSDPLGAVKSAFGDSLETPLPHLQLTRRTGWYDEGKSFVYPDETFGELKTRLLYDKLNQLDPALGLKSGSLERWRDGLRGPCKYSDYLIFTLSVGAASTLLQLVGEDEGAIFHLQGTEPKKKTTEKTKSSSGKTLAARAGVSTLGQCRKSDMMTFSVTPRAVEDICFGHNNLIMALDEEGREPGGADRSSRGNAAFLPYLVPSGRGTVRSMKATSDRNLKNLTWSAMAITTGETPLDGPQSQRPEGAQVRMIGIPVKPGKRGGIFNRVKGDPQDISVRCKDLAGQVEETIGQNFGVAMPRYLEMLVAQRESLSPRVRKIVEEFVIGVGANVGPWERRFAAKFGMVLAGAMLMSEFKVGPWSLKRAKAAVTRIYKKANSASATTANATDAFLIRIRKLMQAGKRFPALAKGSRLQTTAWGVISNTEGKQVLAIRRERFEQLLKHGVGYAEVISDLKKRGIVVIGSDGKSTRQMLFKGAKRHRYVCLNLSLL